MMEQRQQRQDQTISQIHGILLLSAQHQPQIERVLEQTLRTLERTAVQQEINTREIAALRALIELQTGNGHSR